VPQINDPVYMEKCVLGAGLLSTDAFRKAFARLGSGDFADEANRAVFCAARDMDKADKPIDYATLTAALEKKQIGIEYIVDLANFVPSVANIEYYINAVADNGRNARIMLELQRIQTGGGDLLYELERLAKSERERLKPVDNGMEILIEIEKFIEDLANPKTGKLIKTGLTRLDDNLGGLEKGMVSCIAARPSVGKTAFAMNLLVAAICNGNRAMFNSLEMPIQKLLGRLASATASIDNTLIKLRKVDLKDIARAGEELVALASGGGLRLTDNVRNISGVRSEIERLRPDIVFIDYIQRLGGEGRYEKETYKIQANVDELKRLATVYDCHICMLCQIGRAGDERPTMNDLKSSGSLEEGSDVIMIMDRPHVRDNTKPEWQATVWVAKNKDGTTGEIDLYFDGSHQVFRETLRT
jgi:replicative DNA helicase